MVAGDLDAEQLMGEVRALRRALEAARAEAQAADTRARSATADEITQLRDTVAVLRREMDAQQMRLADERIAAVSEAAAEIDQLREAVTEGRRLADRAAAAHDDELRILRQSFDIERRELEGTIRALRDRLDSPATGSEVAP